MGRPPAALPGSTCVLHLPGYSNAVCVIQFMVPYIRSSLVTCRSSTAGASLHNLCDVGMMTYLGIRTCYLSETTPQKTLPNGGNRHIPVHTSTAEQLQALLQLYLACMPFQWSSCSALKQVRVKKSFYNHITYCLKPYSHGTD